MVWFVSRTLPFHFGGEDNQEKLSFFRFVFCIFHCFSADISVPFSSKSSGSELSKENSSFVDSLNSTSHFQSRHEGGAKQDGRVDQSGRSYVGFPLYSVERRKFIMWKKRLLWRDFRKYIFIFFLLSFFPFCSSL